MGAHGSGQIRTDASNANEIENHRRDKTLPVHCRRIHLKGSDDADDDDDDDDTDTDTDAQRSTSVSLTAVSASGRSAGRVLHAT